MGADSWDPEMKRYVEILIERAHGRPVLQFNRIDFRLAWFRHNFPAAKIVHLYRHPRDQWISSLVNPAEFPKNAATDNFAASDHYYLRMWASDLRYYFPFLDESRIDHPYQLFYYLWKLSYLFGKRHAHISLAYEDLLKSPQGVLANLFDVLDIRGADPANLATLVDKPRSGRWKEYAGEDWFQRHESRCEEVLADFTSSPHEGGLPSNLHKLKRNVDGSHVAQRSLSTQDWWKRPVALGNLSAAAARGAHHRGG
jgi:hypothetical protein